MSAQCSRPAPRCRPGRPAGDPDTIQDVFFRAGGAQATGTSAAVSLLGNRLGNAPDSVIDDVWAWRADHGNDVGWTAGQGGTGSSSREAASPPTAWRSSTTRRARS